MSVAASIAEICAFEFEIFIAYYDYVHTRKFEPIAETVRSSAQVGPFLTVK